MDLIDEAKLQAAGEALIAKLQTTGEALIDRAKTDISEVISTKGEELLSKLDGLTATTTLRRPPPKSMTDPQ